ncbi:alpha/beta fold hydrolase, partial [Streptomyces blattellae]|uniref:alpha/beta fold hydrolase n=1 Tax=Streptomyces blattellae TaxID=2569855 RepID=UPI0012B76730
MTTSELGGARVRDLDVRGVPLQVTEVGEGPPLLFLHGLHGLDAGAEWVGMLAERFRVVLPLHPGFGLSAREPWCRSVHDLAYLYLDLLEELDLAGVHLVGSSFGGWVAAQMAVRSQERLSDVVLVDPVGIKVGDRWTRDIADIFALDAAEVLRRTYRVPPAPLDVNALSDEELTVHLRNREASAVYGWEPYMYSPGLRRELGRVRVPCLLVWGAGDGIVTVDYGRAFQASVPGA